MNALTLSSYIQQHYGVAPEYPWAKYPDYAVFRHSHHRKWFALLMNIPAHKLGLENDAEIWVVNVKAKPEEIGSLRMMNGIYPAYHMNKEHWLSLNLAEMDEKLLYELIDESFYLTAKK
ncbi:MmcQ/YjbR family DNA-binding protein [Actinobacillus porcinus]|uniref:MmcQ/YjbR family DNA-binding protein n=1 Tax=Actinobacillus porcinus TaxID=51048 RepID=UPI0023568078|nr:MmcQ/YjbR family DNA-binding protein [Actinobacillus porcinus]MCI5764916.1 MmcQ/YjbR family DNA-binding protein [Actinobacillus porcinus]MDY5421904.1 MmcQ/YjbR family DNA-binding protein [Actinobacillus porcinus]